MTQSGQQRRTAARSTSRGVLKSTVDRQGSWIDGQGRAVPPRYIDPVVKARDRLVRRIASKTQRLHEQMSVVKAEVLALVDEYLAQVAAGYDENWKGNAELVTFDGRLKVEVKISEALEFDERLQLAKQKIDHCLRSWTGNARAEVRAIINQAFQVDSKGRINIRSILTLRQLKFDDPVWSEGMALIADSLRIRTTRRYVNVYQRHTSTDRFELLALNWSALGGVEIKERDNGDNSGQ
ncbi:MAG: DUF3164 family protein [Fidelibacterota bacterium]|nr:MAG: DUF3164 family protein [Candidatus Neomarinimicrobiota bacterium]